MDSHILIVGEISYRHIESVSTVIPTQRLVRDIAATGRLLWAEFHLCKHPTPNWLAEWEARIPNYDCQCRAKYLAIKNENPPRFADWFRWTFEIHNAVNQSLTGKPCLSLASAYAIWTIPIPE